LKNKPGRNEPCHCGSVKKFKNCHGKTLDKSPQIWVIVAVLLLVVLWFLFFEIEPKSAVPSYSPAPLIPRQPDVTSTSPGPAPPGKVWSLEHGHWHDAPLGPSSPPIRPLTDESKSQPPGAAPPGKVWSPEHGHWHDQN